MRQSRELREVTSGTLEDVRLYLDAKLPPVLALIPEHVFTVRAGE